jgi:hypothetical protein
MFFCSSIIFFSCDKKDEFEEVSREVSKIKIIAFIKEEKNVDSNSYFVEIVNTEEIKRLLIFSSSPRYSGGYNGRIEYYSKNNNLWFLGNFNTEYNTIVLQYNGKEYDKRFSLRENNYVQNLIKNIEKDNKKNIFGLY